MSEMSRQGITSYKMYMVYDALRVDDGQIFQALQEATRLGALIGVHCENWDVLLQMIQQVKDGGITGPYGHPLSRPAEVEAEAVPPVPADRPAGPRPRLCGASFHRPGLGGGPPGQGSGPEGFFRDLPPVFAAYGSAISRSRRGKICDESSPAQNLGQ